MEIIKNIEIVFIVCLGLFVAIDQLFKLNIVKNGKLWFQWTFIILLFLTLVYIICGLVGCK